MKIVLHVVKGDCGEAPLEQQEQSRYLAAGEILTADTAEVGLALFERLHALNVMEVARLRRSTRCKSPLRCDCLD